VSEHLSFLERPDVKVALDELVAFRMTLTEEGTAEAELPNARAHLRDRGIDVPEGSSVRIVRSVHETNIHPEAPMCNGDRARPVNCHWIGRQWVCDWVCP
jgi:hypothetical protein